MARDGPSDAELVRRVAGGDEAALELLYDRYAGRIYGLAVRLVADDADAEEVVQDVFTRLWRHAGRFDAGRSSLGTWLLTVTRRRAIDTLRARGRRQRSEPLPLHLPADDDVEEAAENEVLAADVAQAVDHLPDTLRQVIVHAYYLGQSHREVAGALGIPLGTVKTRLRAAVERLRNTFSPPEEASGR
ncbi:MAG TPA: sigma-70 family RNA polymerase sigma factor [Bacillota bacterium]